MCFLDFSGGKVQIWGLSCYRCLVNSTQFIVIQAVHSCRPMLWCRK